MVYKPYKYNGENYRSLINLFVMVFLVAFRIYVVCTPSEQLSSIDTYVYLIIAVEVVLPLSQLIAIAFAIYYWYYENYVKPREEENYEEKMK